MSNKNGIEDLTTPPVKTRFYEVCMALEIQVHTFRHIARKAGVSFATVKLMFIGEPVHHNDAGRALAAITLITGHVWNMNNVNVPLINEDGTQ